MDNLPPEMMDFVKVLEFGAKKYGKDAWLEGKHFDFQKRHDNIFHHLAKSYAGIRFDDESGLDHLLHVICNAQMMYTLKKRGLDK